MKAQSTVIVIVSGSVQVSVGPNEGDSVGENEGLCVGFVLGKGVLGDTEGPSVGCGGSVMIGCKS